MIYDHMWFVCTDSDCIFIAKSLNDAMQFIRDSSSKLCNLAMPLYLYDCNTPPIACHYVDGKLFFD